MASSFEGQTRLIAWEEVKLQGEDSRLLTLGSPFPELAATLSACASSYLLVTRGSVLTESSWWRETLSIATEHVCPPPSVNLMQSVHTLVKRIVVVSGGTQMFNIRLRLHFVQRAYAVFSNHRMTESMVCTLQVLQNSRFPWHKVWASWQLAQILAYMEKGRPQVYLEMVLVKRVLYGRWQLYVKTLWDHN